MSNSNIILLAENTKRRKQTDLLSKSNAILLAENTEMRKQTDLLSKSNAILLIEFDFIHFSDAIRHVSHHLNLILCSFTKNWYKPLATLSVRRGHERIRVLEISCVSAINKGVEV